MKTNHFVFRTSLFALLFALTFTTGCGKKQPPPVDPDASVQFVLKGNPYQSGSDITIDLSDEQAQCFIDLVSSPPEKVYPKGEGTFISLTPMHRFRVGDTTYLILNASVFCEDEDGTKFVWSHSFAQAINDSGANSRDDLIELFETMTDYDWPESGN